MKYKGYTLLLACLVLLLAMACSGTKKSGKADKVEALPPPPPPPPPPPLTVQKDTDGDGIADDYDRCPNQPGVAQFDGCPEAPDDEPVMALPGGDDGSGEPPPQAGYGSGYASGGGRGTAHGSRQPALTPAEASITYSYKDKVPKGGSVLVHVIIQLNKPLVELEQRLRTIIDERPSVETGRTDTSIIRSRKVSGDKRFYVQLECDNSFFRVDSLSPGVQELSAEREHIWKWRVYGLEATTGSPITLTVYSVDDAGNRHNIDNGVLNLQVTVVPASTGQPSIEPKQQKNFWQRYGWWMALPLALLAAVVFWLVKRKKGAAAGRRIYFSYAWNEQDDTLIAQLYDSLKRDGWNVFRDKINLQYKGMISDFMTDIGKADMVLVFISDKYLKSKFCMFELYEVYKNSKMHKEDFLKKIFPVRMEDIRLDDPAVINNYVNYWEGEEARWVKIIQENADNLTPEQSNQYQVLKRIITELGTLLFCLADMNSLTKQQLAHDDFAELKNAIRRANV